jgi:hypothetical protein
MNKVGIVLSVESGGFISGIASAERSVESLTQAMKQAQKEGRNEDFVRLQIQRDTLSASTFGFKRDTQKLFNEPRLQTTTASGATVLKMDADQAMSFKDLNSSIKKLTSVYVDQINNKDLQGAQDTFSQLQQKQGEYKKKVEEVTNPTIPKTAQDVIKAIGINQIAGAINDGFSRWVGSLDRSGIVNQYGSGDILGGRLSEKRRQANLWGGIAQGGLTIGGTALGFLLGGPGGAMLGGTLGSAAGNAVNTGLQIGPNKEATENAFAGLWQQRSADAMNLNALMGRDAVIGDRNMVREAFKEAADAAAKFGYSAEEGMDAINQAVRQGLNGDRARDITEKVFHYERSTGADRGTLSSVANMAARYGAGDALKAGWGGLGASGMTPGQYNEYLRGLQHIMVDSISKGFVKSADQVAANFTLLAQMTNNNPLWQGENGARRLSEMNAGLERATGLQSTSDIVAYRAAQNIAKGQGRGSSYLDAMKILEGGLTPNLFNEYMRLTKNVEGGNKEATVERMRQTFGLNYTNATALYEGWRPGMSDASMKALVDQYKDKPLPNANGPELDVSKATEQIRNIYTQIGQIKFEDYHRKHLEELDKAKKELVDAISGNKKYQPKDTAGMTPDEALKARQADYTEALKKGTNEEFEEAARRAERARVEAFAPRRSIFDEIPNIQNGITTTIPGFFKKGNRREDKTAENKMFNIFDTALRSGEEGQIQTAHDAFRRFQSVPKEVREKWDNSNAINPLADSNGVQALLTALNRLIEIEERNETIQVNVF